MPHLRELVKLHESQPFAIVGVNTNDSPEAYREGVEKFDVSWISAYQGQESWPISEQYKVEGYPTYVLLDPAGKILYKGHDAGALDAPIESLLAEMAD